MNYTEDRNSFVIVARQHNPSVFLGSFFEDSGMIESSDEINKEKSVITPAFAQIYFNNSDTIQIEPERLKIDSKFGESAFFKGTKYIESLPHITCNAIGINFRYKISDVDIDHLFNWGNKDKYVPRGFDALAKYKDKSCFIALRKSNQGAALLNLNFDYRFTNDVKISALDMDIMEERTRNLKLAKEIMNELFS